MNNRKKSRAILEKGSSCFCFPSPTSYTLGNEDRPLGNMPFDYWRQARDQATPQMPQGVWPVSEAALCC
ncbi:MAG TPA: hypothetical protein VGL38_11920 [bacterium]